MANEFGFVEDSPSNEFGFVEDSPSNEFGFVADTEQEKPKDNGVGFVEDSGKRVARGVITGIGDVVKATARMANSLLDNPYRPYTPGAPSTPPQPRTPQQKQDTLEADPLYQFGQGVGDVGQGLQTNPARDQNFGARVAEGIGSTLPSMALGVVGGLPALYAVYGAQSGEQAAEEAVDKGHPEAADTAFLLNAGLGVTTEALLGGVSKRIVQAVQAARKSGLSPTQFGASVREQAVKLAAKAGKAALREGVQEGTEQVGQNIIARWLYDNDRTIGDGVVDAALTGAAVGGLFGAAHATAEHALADKGLPPMQTPSQNAPNQFDPNVTGPQADVPFRYASGREFTPIDLPNLNNRTLPPEPNYAPLLTDEEAQAGLYNAEQPGDADGAPGLLSRLKVLNDKDAARKAQEDWVRKGLEMTAHKRPSQERVDLNISKDLDEVSAKRSLIVADEKAQILQEAASVLEKPGSTFLEKVQAGMVIDKLSQVETPEESGTKKDQSQIPPQVTSRGEWARFDQLQDPQAASTEQTQPQDESNPSAVDVPVPVHQLLADDLQQAMRGNQAQPQGNGPITDFSEAQPTKPQGTLADVQADKLADAEANAPDKIVQTLDRWIKATDTDFRNLYSDTLLVKTIGTAAARTVLKVVRAAYIGGKDLTKAINAGIAHLKKSGVTFNEAQTRAALIAALDTKPYERDINVRARSVKIEESKAYTETQKNLIRNTLYDIADLKQIKAAAEDDMNKWRQQFGPTDYPLRVRDYLRSEKLSGGLEGAHLASYQQAFIDALNEDSRVAHAKQNLQMEAMYDQALADFVSFDFTPQGTASAQYLAALSREAKHTFGSAVKTAQRIFQKRAQSDMQRGKKMVVRQLTQAELAELKKITDDIAKLPKDALEARQERSIDLMNKFQEFAGDHWWDLPVAFFYHNMLSGPFSHFRNTVGNLYNIAAGVGISVVRNPTALWPMLNAMGKALPEARRRASRILKTGKNVGERASKANPQGILERTRFRDKSVLLAPLDAWKYVTRAMAAEDAFMWTIAKAPREQLLAQLVAKKEGLSGAAARRRAAELLNQMSGVKQAAEAKAASEGLKPNTSAFKRRVDEIIQAGKDSQVAEGARDFATRTTFNNEVYGALGEIAKAINSVNDKVVITRAIIPFVNITSNVLNEGLNYTPVGAVRWAMANKGGKLYGVHADAETRGDVGAKAAMGLSLMAAFAAMVVGGWDDEYKDKIPFSGSGPTDPGKRQAWLAAGNAPYSLKIGGVSINYLQTPLAIPFAILGNYMDATREGKLDKADIQDRLAYSVAVAGSSFFSMSFLTSLNRFMDGVSRPSVDKPVLLSLGAQTATSVVIPQVVRDLERYWDPTVTDTKTMEGAVLAQIPFVRALGKPALNGLGEVIQRYPHDSIAKPTGGDPVWTLIAESNAGVYPGSVEYKGTPLSEQQKYELVRMSGLALREAIERRLDRLSALPPEKARHEISVLATEIRNRYKAKAAQ